MAQKALRPGTPYSARKCRTGTPNYRWANFCFYRWTFARFASYSSLCLLTFCPLTFDFDLQRVPMKAIVVREFGPPEVMKLEEVPTLSPGPGQVLVRVKAVGVNPVETYIRAGTYARKPNLPYTPGTDVAGVVEAVGPGVTSVKNGRPRVRARHGGHRRLPELTLCEEAQVHALPERLSFQQGAALGRAVQHRVARAVPPRTGAARRNGPDPRRQRRRRRGGDADRPRVRAARDWHRRNRKRHAAGARAGCARGAEPPRRPTT